MQRSRIWVAGVVVGLSGLLVLPAAADDHQAVDVDVCEQYPIANCPVLPPPVDVQPPAPIVVEPPAPIVEQPPAPIGEEPAEVLPEEPIDAPVAEEPAEVLPEDAVEAGVVQPVTSPPSADAVVVAETRALPMTGSNAGLLLLVAGLLTAVGATVLTVGRRRAHVVQD